MRHIQLHIINKEKKEKKKSQTLPNTLTHTHNIDWKQYNKIPLLI